MPRALLPSERQQSGRRPYSDSQAQHIDVEFYRPREPVKYGPMRSDPFLYAGTPTRGDSHPTHPSRRLPPEPSQSSRDSRAYGQLAPLGDPRRKQTRWSFDMPHIKDALRPPISAHAARQTSTEAPPQHRNDCYDPFYAELLARGEQRKKSRDGYSEEQKSKGGIKGKRGSPRGS